MCHARGDLRLNVHDVNILRLQASIDVVMFERKRRSTRDVFRKENVDNMVVKFQPLINDTSSIILEINISRWSTVMRLTSVQVQGELPAHQDFALAQKLGFGRCATCGALL